MIDLAVVLDVIIYTMGLTTFLFLLGTGLFVTISVILRVVEKQREGEDG